MLLVPPSQSLQVVDVDDVDAHEARGLLAPASSKHMSVAEPLLQSDLVEHGVISTTWWTGDSKRTAHGCFAAILNEGRLCSDDDTEGRRLAESRGEPSIETGESNPGGTAFDLYALWPNAAMGKSTRPGIWMPLGV